MKEQKFQVVQVNFSGHVVPTVPTTTLKDSWADGWFIRTMLKLGQDNGNSTVLLLLEKDEPTGSGGPHSSS